MTITQLINATAFEILMSGVLGVAIGTILGQLYWAHSRKDMFNSDEQTD